MNQRVFRGQLVNCDGTKQKSGEVHKFSHMISGHLLKGKKKGASKYIPEAKTSHWEVPMPLSLVTWTLFVVAFFVSFVVALVASGNAV